MKAAKINIQVIRVLSLANRGTENSNGICSFLQMNFLLNKGHENSGWYFIEYFAS